MNGVSAANELAHNQLEARHMVKLPGNASSISFQRACGRPHTDTTIQTHDAKRAHDTKVPACSHSCVLAII